MNFFGVYGYKIRDLGVDGFINSFKCKKVLKSNLFRTIEGLKNFINANSDTLNKNIEFSEMSFDDLLYECFSTSDYVQDTFGYQESRLPLDGFMWFPEFCRINNSLDRSLREAAFEQFKPGVRIVCCLFNHLRGVGEAFDELLTHDDPSKGLSYEEGYLRLDRIGLTRGVVPVRDLSLSMSIGEQLKLQHKIGGRIYHVEVIYPYPTDPGIYLARDLDTFESMYIGEYSLIKEAYEGLFMINRKLVFGWWNRSLNILDN